METKKKENPASESVARDLKKIVFDADTRKKLLIFLKEKERRLESMLVWCSIFVLVSYTALVLSIIKCYASFTSQQPAWLVIVLVLIVIMLGAFIKLQYRFTTYKPLCTNVALKELLNFKAHMASRQLKLLAAYIIVYSLIVGGSCILCWYSAAGGAQKILALTAPISIMVYGSGLFLLAKLLLKRRAYLNYICTIDQSIANLFNKQ